MSRRFLLGRHARFCLLVSGGDKDADINAVTIADAVADTVAVADAVSDANADIDAAWRLCACLPCFNIAISRLEIFLFSLRASWHGEYPNSYTSISFFWQRRAY